MKIPAIVLLIALSISPAFAESKKVIAVPKDSEIGRYEIHDVYDQSIRMTLKLDTKTGDAWRYALNAKGVFWIPIKESVPLGENPE
jgi:uncharacterized protein involved in high-affinity Fe2+ transport